MSRNASGTYTLPTGNPVVSGTLIEASWANTTLSDIATALTDSLSRSGEGGMNAALRLYDGTSSVPGLAWGSETTTGWYRAGAGDMRLVITGSQVIQYLSTGVAITGTLSSSGNASVGGTLAVTGATTLTAGATIQGLTVGRGAGAVSTNTAVGASALAANTTGAQNTAVGSFAGTANTTGANSAWFGAEAGRANTTGDQNTGIGRAALFTNTTGSYNSALGWVALGYNTAGNYNTALGHSALYSNTTASNNTAVGYQAGYSNTTGAQNLNLGNFAGYTNATGTYNVFVGYQAGYNSTAGTNCFVGVAAGYGVTTGTGNTFIGANSSSASGYYVTTGSKNTIIGAYNGNQGGLDIRTANNYIVLSDGDGNPRGIFNSSGDYLIGNSTAGFVNDNSYFFNIGTGYGANGGVNHISGTASGVPYLAFGYNGAGIGSITQNGTTAVSYNTSSDYRLKEDIQPMTGALKKVARLKPVTYKWKADGSDGEGFIAHELQEVCVHAVTGEKDAVDAKGKPVYQGVDTSFLVATLAAAIQELKSELDSVKAELATLKGN